jgi:hypothetical protein
MIRQRLAWLMGMGSGVGRRGHDRKLTLIGEKDASERVRA